MAIDKDFLEWVKDRCHVEEDGCWKWKYALHDKISPQGKYLGRVLLVRREIIQQRSEKLIPKGWITQCRCGTLGCVRPDHIYAVSRSKAFKGKPKTLAHRVAMAVVRRAKSKYTFDQIEFVRYGPGLLKDRAAEVGMGLDYASMVYRNLVWRDYRNPFAGLIG